MLTSLPTDSSVGDWTTGAAVLAATADITTTSDQPELLVHIAGSMYRIAGMSSDRSQILVDITDSSGSHVQVGDQVCLLCSQHRLGHMSQVGADG